jgi:hypothetical protein
MLTFSSPENRLERRDALFCEDDTIALAIKSGDSARIKWLFDKGYPLNYNIMDTDGMCYEATELAKHHNQDEVGRHLRLFFILSCSHPRWRRCFEK